VLVSLVLLKKIIAMLIMVLFGFLAVRTKKLRAEDSTVLSNLILYVILPCSILSSFQTQPSSEVLKGLALSFGAALFYFLVMLLVTKLIRKPLKLTTVEEMSVFYPNSGYLTFPLVIAVFGSSDLIYATGLFVLSVIFQWTHGVSHMKGERGVNIKKIVTNLNLIVVVIAMLLMFTGVKFPSIVADTISSVGSMIGPLSMLITGMLIGEKDFKELFGYKRLPLVLLLRLVLVPLLFLFIFKLSGVDSLFDTAGKVMLIGMFAVAAPSAATVTQFAAVFGEDASYASAINLVSTVCCVVTMPLIILLYQIL